MKVLAANPYLDAFERVKGASSINAACVERYVYCHKWSWAVPNERAIKLIASLGPIIECGAGTGYWASLIKSVGGNILAFDEAPYKNHWCEGKHTKVFMGNADVCRKTTRPVLLLCWPPYDDSFAADCLVAFGASRTRRNYKRRVVFIGESEGGCTGDDAFFKLLNERWSCIDQLDIPQWYGIHDYLFVYEEK